MTLAKGTYRLIVASGQDGLRLDLFLAAALATLTRSTARRLIELGGVHVEGRRIRRCSLEVAAGQGVTVHVDGLPLEPYQLDPASILFKDRYLLAIDKPAGVATQPTPARYQGTLYAALQQFLGKPGQLSLGMVQRLDRDTSGVIIFSIHPRAHKGLTAAFSGRGIVKRYLALVAGVPDPPAGEFQSLLARRHATNRTVSVARGGKPAVTRYRVVQSFEAAALVEVEIPTGRSHQIRAHFSEAGYPLLGDVAYGGRPMIGTVPVGRQMLHASELHLQHPVGGEPLALTAPLPGDFRTVLEALDRAAGTRFPETPNTAVD